jgi:succinate dehydrogenase/fumarate reductase flavoprotein subunit
VEKDILQTDVLCIGGGIAGLMAAIHARENGAKVIVCDKANTVRSGSASTGNDHFRCYIPEYHGPDIDPIVNEILNSQGGITRSREIVYTWMGKSFEIVKLWDGWGIPMKHDGKWDFSGHAYPGQPRTALKYAGRNQKRILTAQARKKDIEIVNRVMVFDLILHDHGFTAIGLSTRENKLYLFNAKSVVLSTGGCVGLYPSPTPASIFNRASCPACTGDGRAIAFRVGAELINMEIPQRWAGPKYFSRCGKATWIGVLKDPDNRPVGPFVSKPDRRYGDAIADVYHSLFEDYFSAGNGPVYMDCRGISDDDYNYMMWGLRNEGNQALLQHLEEQHIDLRKNPVEFMTYEMTTRGGIYYNEKSETSVPGLYAAGDEYFGGISPAATFGWIAGDNAAHFAAGKEMPDTGVIEHSIEEKVYILEEIKNRKNGASWQEAYIALQQIMADYAGPRRSENMLQTGLQYLRQLKQQFRESICAYNQHQLTHVLEIMSLFEIGELVFIAAIEHKESRGNYARIDYPYTNPQMNKKALVCRKEGSKILAEWKEIKR